MYNNYGEAPLPLGTSHSRLRKPVAGENHIRSPSNHSRSASSQRYAADPSPSLHDLRTGYNWDESENPLEPPPPVLGGAPHSRSSSIDWSSRPNTPGSSTPGTPAFVVTPAGSRSGSPTAQGEKKDPRRPSWFGAGAGKLRKDNKLDGQRPLAWVAEHPDHLPYDVNALIHAQPMKDIWDQVEGNCFIYLFPRMSGKGPSFKVNSAILAASPILTRLAFGDLYSPSPDSARGRSGQPHLPLEIIMSNSTLNERSTTNSNSEPEEVHLYLPIKLHSDGHILTRSVGSPPKGKHDASDPGLEDLQTLIDIRNFFAFLCGQSFVATEAKSSLFSIFLTIATILKTYEFSNLDGSTFGEVASSSFDSYVEELRLADVRSSREKTVQGLILGERMRSVPLYNEAFIHTAGKYDDIAAMKHSKFSMVNAATQNKIQLAAMSLQKRTASIQLILENFEFPALFTGIAASKMSQERKEGVRFEPWKDGFFNMRKTVLSMLKHKYGDWPPKAKSKKNNLETSGLNRLVLQDLYADMCAIYDLLVDRTNLTTRTVDGSDLAGDRQDPHVRALRTLLAESDRSSPPVKPPIPFDLPRLPTLEPGMPSMYSTGDKKKDPKAMHKKLKSDDLARVLQASHNRDVPPSSNPFIASFLETESRAAHGCTLAEIIDLRVGHWIFIYVVLQALPLLASDAPGVKWSQGVEYFLSEAPRSGLPWLDPSRAASNPAITGAHGNGRTWFTVENGGGVVSLPSDVLVHSIEGIYRRSHCWTIAERWTEANPMLHSALHEHEANTAAAAVHTPTFAPTHLPANTNLLHPSSTPSFLLPPTSSSRSPSPSRRHSSLTFGLEALPLPAGVSPDGSEPGGSAGLESGAGGPRSFHQVDKERTFDAILAGNKELGAGEGKRGRRK